MTRNGLSASRYYRKRGRNLSVSKTNDPVISLKKLGDLAQLILQNPDTQFAGKTESVSDRVAKTPTSKLGTDVAYCGGPKNPVRRFVSPSSLLKFAR